MNILEEKKIVERIFSLWDEGEKGDDTIAEKIHSEFQICLEDALAIIELTQMGALRGSIIAGGTRYPKNNLENNSVIKAAIKITLDKLGKPEVKESEFYQKKYWWKFW